MIPRMMTSFLRCVSSQSAFFLSGLRLALAERMTGTAENMKPAGRIKVVLPWQFWSNIQCWTTPS